MSAVSLSEFVFAVLRTQVTTAKMGGGPTAATAAVELVMPPPTSRATDGDGTS